MLCILLGVGVEIFKGDDEAMCDETGEIPYLVPMRWDGESLLTCGCYFGDVAMGRRLGLALIDADVQRDALGDRATSAPVLESQVKSWSRGSRPV